LNLVDLAIALVAGEGHVEILLARADDSLELSFCRSFADKVTGAEQVKDYLCNLIAALNDAAVLAEFSRGTAVVDLAYRRPFPGNDSRWVHVELNLEVLEVEI
jgi:hypothetical protein